MCTESACVEPNALDPFANQSRILARRDRSAGVAATGKKEFARLLVESSHILINGLACLLGQLKPDGLTCFLLTHCRTVNRISVRCDVLDLQSNDIATAQLAIDGHVEHGKVTDFALHLKLGPDRPHELWTEWRLCAD